VAAVSTDGVVGASAYAAARRGQQSRADRPETAIGTSCPGISFIFHRVTI